jgi:basic amino acid/polyamine antiporter, APA family
MIMVKGTLPALFATTNTVLMMLVSGSRIVFGMAKDSSIPNIFTMIHKHNRTPWVAAFATMILTIAAIVLSSGNINTVASLSVFGIFIVFAIVNFSVIWLRFKQPNVNRTFMSPFKLKGFPVLAGLGLLTVSIMLFLFSHTIILSSTILIGILFLISFSLGRYSKKTMLGKGHIPPSSPDSSSLDTRLIVRKV